MNESQNLIQKISNKQFPIPPSLGKNSQSLTNNMKPYNSNLVYDISTEKIKAGQYQTNPIYSNKKPKQKIKNTSSPIEILIEKDQAQKEEYQIDLNTPQFKELMGFKGAPQIEKNPLQESEGTLDQISKKSTKKFLQYQNSGITFKDSFIPRGDSLMSQNSKISLNTLTNSNTDGMNQNSIGFSPQNKFHMISSFAQQKSPSFQPDMSGSGQSPEINLKQFLTPESARKFKDEHFSKKKENYDTLRSDELFIENKEIEGKGSNFSLNQEESQLESEGDISLECTTESLNFGLHWSPGVEKRESQLHNHRLSNISGKKI